MREILTEITAYFNPFLLRVLLRDGLFFDAKYIFHFEENSITRETMTNVTIWLIFSLLYLTQSITEMRFTLMLLTSFR